MKILKVIFAALLVVSSYGQNRFDLNSSNVFVVKDGENNLIGKKPNCHTKNKSQIQIDVLDTTIMCVQGFLDTTFVIRNQSDYEKLLAVRSPHPDCKDYVLPPINFERYLLIGIRRSSAGLYVTFDKQITYENNVFLINYQITQHGSEERLNHTTKYFLLEKLHPMPNVRFNYKKKFEKN